MAKTEELILTVVIGGSNVMGEPLCEMNGILSGGKKVRKFRYKGPVTSAKDVAEAIESLFQE